MKLNQNLTAKGESVIAMSLSGRNPQYTYGAIRNAQLLPLYFPTWKLRLYLLKDSPEVDPDLLVPKPVIDKLILLNVEVVFLNPDFSQVNPGLWKYQVADDTSVKQFLIRDPRGRFSERDSFLVGEWLKGKLPFFCIRDKQEHAKAAVVPGLFGVKGEKFSEILKPNVASNLLTKSKAISSEGHLLNTIIWPKVQGQIGCFDSVSKDKWPGVMNITLEGTLKSLSPLGTWYNEFEEEIQQK